MVDLSGTRHLRRRALLLLPLAAVILVIVGIIHASASPPDPSAAPACVDPEPPQSLGYDSATREDAGFNSRLRHCFTTVNGVQMHYVIGGTGPQTMVLLHGWPESWYEFHDVMPELLEGRTVIAIDLPGLGDSTGEPVSYAKTTLADYVHGLLARLGKERDVQVVAHDFGVGVAYALAAEYRQQAAGLLLMDFALVGKNVSFNAIQPLSWHFSFNRQEPLAEDLVTGRVATFLNYFFDHSQISASAQVHEPPSTPHPVPPDSIAEFVRVYSRPQVLHGGFELYRTWPQDEADNKRLQETPLDIPVRMLAQDGFGDLMLSATRDAAPAATGTEVDNAGHWLVEDEPARVVDEINAFYPTDR
ncbi:MAG TPA: alpha/beta hydrolase [Mycobacterium sp.]|nr:alpha/beta hydrolase [Mycobacterium sp.]